MARAPKKTSAKGKKRLSVLEDEDRHETPDEG